MPKFSFISSSQDKQNQENQKIETRITSLDNFTLLSPNIDAGAGRSRQIIFAIGEFFSYLTKQTQYAKSESELRQYFSRQEKEIIGEQKNINAEIKQALEGLNNILTNQDLDWDEKINQSTDFVAQLSKLNSLVDKLTKNLEKLQSSATRVGKTIFDNKNAFREGVMESHAFILKQLKVAYGIEWQQWEIIAAKFAGLAGIIAPNTFVAIDATDQDHHTKTLAELKQQAIIESPQSLQIASQRLKGYYDLSSFLINVVNQYPHELLADGQIDKYHELRNAVLKTNGEEKQQGAKTPQTKQKKADLYLQIYQLLPSELKDQMNELRVVSAWIGNWDMFNWDLDNCGFCVRRGKDGKISIEPAMVDFGNSLFNGFGGAYKHNSKDLVNRAAKTQDVKPQDFDPEIGEKDQVIAGLMGFREEGAVDLLLSRFPRRLPFQALFAEENKHLLKFLSDCKDFDVEQISQGTLRGLYRIALISDQAIEKMVRKWYVFEGENLFNKVPQNADDQGFREKLTPDYLIKLMKDRRDDFVGKFKPLIQRYERHYEVDALATKYEVEAAAIDISSVKPIDLKPDKPGSFTSEFSATRLQKRLETQLS